MLKAYFQISTFDSKNQLKKKSRRLLSRSFVQQFVQMLYVAISGLTYTVKDTSNTGRTAYSLAGYHFFYCVSGGGDGYTWINPNGGCPGADMGIVIGTGTTAVTAADYKLATAIAHGTETGKMQYLGMFFPVDVTVSAPTASFNIERMFKNSSGGDVVVNELGIVCAGFSYAYPICIVRDVLSSPVTVANGEYLKVTYTISVSA